jgi:hypothetical protein
MNEVTKIKQPGIIAALAKALPELESAKKNKANPAFKSKYADLAAMIEAIEPIAKHGLWFRQVTIEHADGACVETFYIHDSGEQLSAGITFTPASKRDAQGFGSALTYCRRYALQTAFGLATEDDDGNAATKAPPAQQAAKQPAHSKLKTELRQFVHEMNGCGDGDELSAFLATPEAIRIVNETREKLPHLWDGNNWPESMPHPEEFVPLSDQISRRQRECAATTASYATA